jgi:hypothetical protein
VALSGLAHGASKARIAAIGDGAPGGGVFVGPGFGGWPTAAGDGWIAFRGEITGGSTSETLVVAHMTAPVTRAQVASLGQQTPSGGAFADCAGKLKQFLGHPVVNAKGDVAFIALIDPPADAEPDDTGLAPTRAGIFVMRGGQLSPVACSRQPSPGGILDLTAVVDLLSEEDVEIADRSPAINDAGDVAFLTGYVTDKGFPAGAGIVFASHGGGLVQVVRVDGAFESGKFLNLGPPALNNNGLVAFHALATTTEPNDGNGLIDGIFAAEGGTLRIVVRDGIAPVPADQPLTEFQDPISLNDRGDVAFLAGPLFDLSDDASLTDVGSPGVLVSRAGVVTLVAYAGQQIGLDKVTSVALGPTAGGQLATPAIAPDGTVVLFVSLNGGNAEAIVRWDGSIVLPLFYTAGNGADESPAGGIFAGTGSAPATDAAGGVAFLARIVGGPSAEAIVYRAADGSATPIVLGEAAPRQNEGFFGGRPFSAPRLNDRGDVVFRAFVARGPSSVGIFRARDGDLEPLVRAGDPSPAPGAPPFLDLVGDPGLNERGDVAFAAQLPTGGQNLGRGIFVLDASGLRTIVLRGDSAPGTPGTIFTGFGPNPQINDAGGVAFKGTTSYRDPLTGFSIKQEAIFLSDAAGTRVLVYADEPSPSGLPFLRLRDPFLTNAPSVVFRAPLGVSEQQSSGIFLADARGTAEIAVEKQSLGEGVVLTGFSGNPSVTADGQVAFLATRSRPVDEGGAPIRPLGPAIFRRLAAGLEQVIARDMPGPAGGSFKNVGAPAINAAGHVVFRGSFQPLTGGTPGLFLAGDGELTPYVLRGEVSPLGGTLSGFALQPSLNAHDEAAFIGSISSGKARSAVLVASPTTLVLRRLALRLSDGRGRDRLALRLVLTPGSPTACAPARSRSSSR